MEITTELISTYRKLFVNCEDRRALQQTDGSYRVIYEPLTDVLLKLHLEGFLTLGFPAMSLEFNCKWAVWDSDKDSGDLFRIEAVLKQLDLIPLREGGRRGRDGHLWLFFDRPIAARSLRRLNTEICAHARVKQKSIEFFPKQDSFELSPGPVRGPLGRHRKAGAGMMRGLFSGAGSEDLEVQLNWLAAQPLNPADVVESMVRKLVERDEFISKYIPPRIVTTLAEEYDPETVFADLQPEMQPGGYFICKCPDCGEREAYFYRNRSILICNRLDKCKFKISVEDYAKRKAEIG